MDLNYYNIAIIAFFGIVFGGAAVYFAKKYSDAAEELASYKKSLLLAEKAMAVKLQYAVMVVWIDRIGNNHTFGNIIRANSRAEAIGGAILNLDDWKSITACDSKFIEFAEEKGEDEQ